MEELAIQEDVIFEMEREYNEAVAANHLGGLLRGWDGLVHPKKCLDALPKEARKFCTFNHCTFACRKLVFQMQKRLSRKNMGSHSPLSLPKHTLSSQVQKWFINPLFY